MYQLKIFIKALWLNTTWFLARLIVPFVKRYKSDKVLLVPASNLDGGFGEDIMVSSFLENFAHSRPVTIFTWSRIDRDDYLKRYPNVKLLGGFTDTMNFVSTVFMLRKYSLVYVIGADIMDGAYSNVFVTNRLRLMKLALKLGIDAQISGFSISEKINENIKKGLFDVSRFTTIKARDIDSYNRLSKFIHADRLLLTNDLAFICPNVPETYQTDVYNRYKEWVRLQRENDRKVIAVCPNSIQAAKFGLSKYNDAFKDLLRSFTVEGDISFVFLYHDLRPLCGNESDRSISAHLFNYYSSNTNIPSFYTDDIRNGVELKGYLELADYTVTGRMHFGISGLTYGKPMFGIAYANKFEGMLRSFNIDPSWCLVDYTNMDNKQGLVGAFTENYQLIKDNIEKQVSTVKLNTLANYKIEYV